MPDLTQQADADYLLSPQKSLCSCAGYLPKPPRSGTQLPNARAQPPHCSAGNAKRPRTPDKNVTLGTKHMLKPEHYKKRYNCVVHFKARGRGYIYFFSLFYYYYCYNYYYIKYFYFNYIYFNYRYFLIVPLVNYNILILCIYYFL